MNPVFVLIVIIGILASITNKKRKMDAEKKAQQQQQPPYPPQHSPGAQMNRQTRPMNQQTKQATGTVPAQSKKSTPGVDSKWPWPTADQAKSKQPKSAAASYGGTPRYTHVVMSTLEGGHTHTESSMTGEEDCPPPVHPSSTKLEGSHGEQPAGAPLLSFNANSVLQGVLYSEILGKPRALQKN